MGVDHAFSKNGDGVLVSVELGMKENAIELDAAASLVREDASWKMWPQGKFRYRGLKVGFTVVSFGALFPVMAYAAHRHLHGHAITTVVLRIVAALCVVYIVYALCVSNLNIAQRRYAFGVAWYTGKIENVAMCAYPQDGHTDSRRKSGKGNRCGHVIAPSGTLVAACLVVLFAVAFVVKRRSTDAQAALIAGGALAAYALWMIWLYVSVSSESFLDNPIPCSASSPCLATLLEQQKQIYGCPGAGGSGAFSLGSLACVSIVAFASWKLLPPSLQATRRAGATFIIATTAAACIGVVRDKLLLGPFNGACDTMNEVVLRSTPGGLDVSSVNFTRGYFEKHGMAMPDGPMLIVQGGNVEEIVPKKELQQHQGFYSGIAPEPMTSVLVFKFDTADSKPTVTRELFTDLLQLYE